MSNVIRFRPANSRRRMASGDCGAAQILFFTGVRYQRWGEDTHAPARRAQGARKEASRAPNRGAKGKSQR